MNAHTSAEPAGTRPAPWRPTAFALLRQAEHVLFAGLLVLGLVRTVAQGDRPWWAVALGVVALGWYGTGMLLASRPAEVRRRRQRAVLWLTALTLLWVALAVVSADFVWVVFALFLLHLQLLPSRVAIPVVLLLAGISVAAVAVRQGLTVPVVLGPLIGAAVAIVITAVYRDLREEAERRERLMAELTAAQERLAAAERYAGTLAERQRLARELHDTVAQGLSSVVLLLRSVRDRAGTLPEPAEDQLDAAVAAARGALDETRRVVRALTPAELSGQSLAEALKRVVQDAAPVGIRLGLTVDGEPYELPTPTAVALLRTAQGALGNVIGHSRANRARVTLTYQPGQVSLDVADDGIGFDTSRPPTPTSRGTGIGLSAMRSRLEDVGGRLVVESAPGEGTAVGATIPTDAAMQVTRA
ncbi:MAG TPA: sensor histidine kinase [Segeticoccus sp.]|nr:sensor histidine kinase [Segeticoccus sp.]